MTSLTNLPELDLEIFNHLEGPDIYSLCLLNTYNYHFCIQYPHLKDKYNRYIKAINNTKKILDQLTLSRGVIIRLAKTIKLSYFSNNCNKFNTDVIYIKIEKYYSITTMEKFLFPIRLYSYDDIDDIGYILTDLFYKGYIKND